jgi:hypothetical protein
VTPLLAGVHLVSYPLLVWLVWVWLGIAESSAAELIGSVALGVLVVAAVAWLLATAFEASLRVLWSPWVRSLLFVVLCLILIGGALWLAGRQPPKAAWIYRAGLWSALAAIIAVLVPLHLLRSWRVLREWRYWMACVLLTAIGGYVPWKLISWVPAATTLAGQATSMSIRFALAYVVSVASLLAFAFAVRRLAAIRTSPTPTT